MFQFGNKRWLPALPSLKVQWVMGALVAMLPLLAAMAYAFWVMDHHNREQRQLVAVSAQVAEIGASISDQTKDLERVARQFQVLQDERIRQVFMQKYADLNRLMLRMKNVKSAPAIPALLTRLNTILSEVETILFQSEGNDEKVALLFKDAHQLTKVMSQTTATWVQQQLDRLENAYKESQMHLLVMGLWALPGTLILVWLISFMVLRPIYQLSNAIQRMGGGDWRTPINISGSNEMVLLGKNLEWMQQQLLTLEAQKHTFLQQITHELKTPLAAIMEAGSLLADEVPGPLNPSQRQVLSILQDNANSLQTLIQQMLDYNSVLKDHAQQVKSTDIKRLFNDKLQDLKGLAEARNVKLVLQGESLNLVVDIVRVSMIIRNLVSNAVQLTPSGKNILVNWGCDQHYWWFQVIDEGPGVRLEERDRLFEPFYQGGATKQGSLKGSGIGLAIVKECTEFLNGEVMVENVKNKGAAFTVRLPLLPLPQESGENLLREIPA